MFYKFLLTSSLILVCFGCAQAPTQINLHDFKCVSKKPIKPKKIGNDSWQIDHLDLNCTSEDNSKK